MAHKDSLAQDDSSDVERFLEAVRCGRSDAVAGALEGQPSWIAEDIFAASAAGDAAGVAVLLEQDRSLVQATHGREEWTALAYASASPLHQRSEARGAGLRRIVDQLLDAGAAQERASVYWESDEKKVPIPALYHACMSDHAAVVELLLQRGANTQDGESIYHAAQHNRRRCLERLLRYGADVSSTQAPYGNTPLYFLAGHHDDEDGRAAWFQGMVWLLEHGADPNVPSGAARETPLHKIAATQPKLAAARALLGHGADPNVGRADGRTPYQLAVRHGNAAIAELMRDHGADAQRPQPIDEFLGACLMADTERARMLLARHSDLSTVAQADARHAIVDAVRQDRPDALRLMASLGFDVASEDPHGGTALHWAAWLGKPELVTVLLALGAPLERRDCQYGASPLGWAAHGSECHAEEEPYCAVVDLLLKAGATREGAVNKWGERIGGSPRVARLIG